MQTTSSTPTSTTIYLGRIPHGFYESEIRGYFSQFGAVSHVRVSRNKKTGASKHYAFVQFASPQVAKIAAETMHGYLLMRRLLQCRVVPEPHPDLWKGEGVFKRLPRNKMQRQKQNATKTIDELRVTATRTLQREEAKRLKIQALGIDYSFEGASRAAKAFLEANPVNA